MHKQSFNDVERRLAPADYENKRTRVEISDAKPEKSLTEIYEDEYQKQKSSESTEPVKQEPKMEHLEIDQLMTTLFAKLDALTNWHFVPKPPQLELKVLSANDAPALEMEDVIPVNVSDAQKLAPQELYAAKKTDLSLKTADELTSQEKKRLRLTKKLQNKKEKRQLERDRKAIAKTNPGLGNKYATKEALKELAGNKV
jgi:U3 small nucleolar RNA-associated protein MPP10